MSEIKICIINHCGQSNIFNSKGLWAARFIEQLKKLSANIRLVSSEEVPDYFMTLRDYYDQDKVLECDRKQIAIDLFPYDEIVDQLDLFSTVPEISETDSGIFWVPFQQHIDVAYSQMKEIIEGIPIAIADHNKRKDRIVVA